MQNLYGDMIASWLPILLHHSSILYEVCQLLAKPSHSETPSELLSTRWLVFFSLLVILNSPSALMTSISSLALKGKYNYQKRDADFVSMVVKIHSL